MTIEEINVLITAQNKEFKDAITDVSNRLENLERTAQSSVSNIGNMFKTLAGGIAGLGIGALIKQCNDAYIVQMTNELKLETVMRRRMGASKEEIQSIKDLASAQQGIGIIGDEVQLAGAQQIATFATQTETIKKLIPAMNNLLVQQHGYNVTAENAVSVASLIGKAMQGQTEALKRANITFTEAQKKVMQYGTEEQRAAMLAQVITENVGEMNEAFRNTPMGGLSAFLNDFGDMLEEIGATFQPVISAFLPIMKAGFEAVRPVIVEVADGVSKTAKIIAEAAPQAKTMLAVAVASAVAIPIVTKAQLLYNAANAALKAILTLLIPKQITFNALLKASLGWIGLVAGALAIFNIVRKKADTSEDFEETEKGAEDAKKGVDDLSDSVEGIGEAAKKSLADIDTLNIASGSGKSAGFFNFSSDEESLENISEQVKELTENNGKKGFFESLFGGELNLSTIFENVKNAFSEFWNWLKNGGWDGIVTGISKAFNTAWNWLKTDGWTGFKNALNKGWNWLKTDGLNGIRYAFGVAWEWVTTDGWQMVQDGVNSAWTWVTERWNEWTSGLTLLWDAFFGDGEAKAKAEQQLMDILIYIEDIMHSWGLDIIDDAREWGENIGTWLFNVTHGDEVKMNELAEKYDSLYTDMSKEIIENLENGYSAKHALSLAKQKILTNNEMIWYFQNNRELQRLTEEKVEEWRKDLEENHFKNFRTQAAEEYSFKDYSGITEPKPISSSWGSRANYHARALEEAVKERDITLYNEIHLEVDGREIAGAVNETNTRDAARSNGY